jgi:hypothetical protein
MGAPTEQFSFPRPAAEETSDDFGVMFVLRLTIDIG